MKLEALIKIASEAYDVLETQLVTWYHKDPTGNYGDGLAKFIAAEIAETYEAKAEDIAQLTEARRTMEQGQRQLSAVIEALLIREMRLEAARRRSTHPIRKQRQTHLRRRGTRVPESKR